jgi:hypothetical protein
VHHHRGGELAYCAEHAAFVRDVLERRIVPLICCSRCGEWRARDLELRRGAHVRQLCASCAEIVDALIDEGSAS